MERTHMRNIWRKLDYHQLAQFLTRFLSVVQAPEVSYVRRCNLAWSVQAREVHQLAQHLAQAGCCMSQDELALAIGEAAHDAVGIELTNEAAREDAAILWAAIQAS